MTVWVDPAQAVDTKPAATHSVSGHARTRLWCGENDERPECKASGTAPDAPPARDLTLAFEFGSDQLTESSKQTLQELAAALHGDVLPSRNLIVDGVAGASGNPTYNLSLSLRRAQAVAKQFVAFGVNRAHLTVRNLGSAGPLAGDASASKNAHVEISLADPAPPTPITAADPAAAPAQTKIALILGEARDQQDSMVLETPANDAADIGDAFRKNGFDVTVKTDLALDDFRRALSDFSDRAAKADVVVVYYAGKGVQVRQENYLLPIDFKGRSPQDLPRQAVALRDVLDAASTARKAKFVIIDASRKRAPEPDAHKADAAGLARVDGAHGLVVFLSQQHDKLALDTLDASRNSPFAEALKRRLLGPATPVSPWLEAVTGDVYQATAHEEEPEIVTMSLPFNSPADEIKWGAAVPTRP